MRVWVLSFLSILAFLAQPAGAATSPGLVSLERQLEYIASAKGSDVGIAAIDLQTGETVAVKGHTPFPMARTMKIAVAALYLSQVEHGRRSLDDTIDGVSARNLMSRMMIRSDNRATDILLADLGGPKVLHQWLTQNGLQGLRVDRNIARLLADKRDLWDVRDSSTPLAMVELLKKIYRAELVRPESRNYILDLMARCQTGKNRIRGMLPFGTPVENKTGTLNGLADDVGFITMPDGRRIAIAVFARGGTDRPKTIAQSARTIYDGFKSLFTWPYRPATAGR